jgi:hypothetical protein
MEIYSEQEQRMRDYEISQVLEMMNYSTKDVIINMHSSK